MLPKNDGGFSCVDTHMFGRREQPVQLRLVLAGLKNVLFQIAHIIMFNRYKL